MKYISLVGCKLSPLDGYMAACLVLAKEVYAKEKTKCADYFCSKRALLARLQRFNTGAGDTTS